MSTPPRQFVRLLEIEPGLGRPVAADELSALTRRLVVEYVELHRRSNVFALLQAAGDRHFAALLVAGIVIRRSSGFAGETAIELLGGGDLITLSAHEGAADDAGHGISWEVAVGGGAAFLGDEAIAYSARHPGITVCESS